ncbi:uncharacterized protein [Euphorbia lathyris]|uniref:uncharacterized protein n=1 Tax=Euphorbia lathyris TaxID=212925 RepID=UPI00331402D7
MYGHLKERCPSMRNEKGATETMREERGASNLDKVIREEIANDYGLRMTAKRPAKRRQPAIPRNMKAHMDQQAGEKITITTKEKPPHQETNEEPNLASVKEMNLGEQLDNGSRYSVLNGLAEEEAQVNREVEKPMATESEMQLSIDQGGTVIHRVSPPKEVELPMCTAPMNNKKDSSKPQLPSPNRTGIQDRQRALEKKIKNQTSAPNINKLGTGGSATAEILCLVMPSWSSSY